MMTPLQTIFHNCINWVEGCAAIVAIIYFNKVKDTYWKWFVIYLIFIALTDIFGDFGLRYFPNLRKYYYDFFVIPIEFIFFYWLYAKKSLQKEKLFWGCCLIYGFFYILHLFNLDQVRIVSSMSYTVGVFLLAIMVYLEFLKQIQSDEILNFNRNKMFYVNIAVLLFYIGTLPFFAFDKFLYQHQYTIWGTYYTFFLLAVNLMYLLFIASFIWGKSKT